MTWAVMKNQHFAPERVHAAKTLAEAKAWLKAKHDKE